MVGLEMVARDDFDIIETDVLSQDEKGTVYRGRERAPGREVAIRVLRDRPAGADPTLCQTFVQEVELLKGRGAENLVHLRGAGIWQDRLFYAADLVAGESLASSRAQGLRFTSDEIFHIAEGTARALRATRPCKVLRCDIRPESILLDKDGSVVVDVTLRRTPGRSVDRPDPSSRGHYASPEEARGEDVDDRSDIYALGVVLYELASGRPPFEGHDSATSLLYQIVHASPTPPRQQGASILPELERLILRCMAKDPQDRYPDPDDLLRELKAIKEGLARARRTGGPEDTLGDFEIYEDQILGEGGMGTLYRGRQRQLRRPVAIKVIREQFTTDPEFVLRFRRESELLAQLSHPNVIQVFGTGIWRGRHFYAMELLEGMDAATRVKEQGRLDAREALHLVEGVAKALSAAWRCRIVHQDIKPSNILLTPSGEVKLADFGLAKSLRVPKSESQLVAGTSEYVSPEQGLGGRVDIRSDIYSLGVVLYELLAGHPPFRSTGSFTQVIYQHVHRKPPPLEEAAGPLPAPLLELVGRCLAKRPEDRYQTPEELLRAISTVRNYLDAPSGVPAPRSRRLLRPAIRGLRRTWQRVSRAVRKISGRSRHDR